MGPLSKIRLLVAGGDDLVLDELCRRIASWPTVEIVGWARSTDEAKSLAAQLAPDVVLIDLEAPAFDGTASIQRIRMRPGAPFLLVLTSRDTPGARTESFAAGADGFVTKADPDEKLRALVSRMRLGP